MAISDFNNNKPIEVTSVTGTPTISRALCLKITSGDDSTTGTGQIVLDWTNISSQADIGVYDENDNLLDYYFGSFDATAETAVIWVYRSWVQDGTVQAKIAYGSGPNDQSVVASTVFDKDSNLQAGWPFNESSGDALDVTSNNNDGTVYGATQGQSGIVDGAYTFDGIDDYVDISGVESLSFSDKATLLTWVKLYNATPSIASKTGIHNLQSSGASLTHYPYTDGNAYISTFRSNRVGGFSLSSNVTRTNWHLVAIITENATDGWKFYQNTELVKTADGESSVVIDATPYLGWASGNPYLEGDQDVTLLFSETFTETDLTAFYDATKSSPDFFSQQAAGGTVADPSITTNSPTNVTGSSATLNGTLDDLGGRSSLDVYFEWGTDTSYGNTTSTQTISSAPTNFSADISNLSGLTTYHYRSVTTDGSTSWYGSDVSFYTYDLRDEDETQSEFQNGTLTDVEADSGDYLRLADTDVLSFDGSNYVEIAHDSALDFSDDFTLEAWFRTTSSGDYQDIIRADDYNVDVNRSWYWVRQTDADYIAFNFMEDGGTNDSVTSSSKYNDGEWHHVAGVCDVTNGKAYLYIDGGLENDISHSQTGPFNPDIAKGIGAWPKSDGTYQENFTGDIIDARFWNTARTQAEVQNNMNTRLTGSEAGLVAYYKLDEGTGTTATDSAGSNDGSISGASWTTSQLFLQNDNAQGNRIVQLDLSSLSNYSDSLIEWTATLNGQSLTIETRNSLDGGSTWSSWQTATSGSAIPGLSSGDDLSNALLECRETLSTSDSTSTPQLERRAIYLVEGAAGTTDTALLTSVTGSLITSSDTGTGQDVASLIGATGSFITGSEVGTSADTATRTSSTTSLLTGSEVGEATDIASLTSALATILTAEFPSGVVDTAAITAAVTSLFTSSETATGQDTAEYTQAQTTPRTGTATTSATDAATRTNAVASFLPASDSGATAETAVLLSVVASTIHEPLAVQESGVLSQVPTSTLLALDYVLATWNRVLRPDTPWNRALRPDNSWNRQTFNPKTWSRN